LVKARRSRSKTFPSSNLSEEDMWPALASLSYYNTSFPTSGYASVNSSGTHPPPPRANPRALAFFKKIGKFPGVGTRKLSKCPGVGTKKEGKCPAPGIVAFRHLHSFLINQWIKRSTVQYFNATVRLQGQQYVLVDSDYIYFFIFVFNSLLENSWDCGGRVPSRERW